MGSKWIGGEPGLIPADFHMLAFSGQAVPSLIRTISLQIVFAMTCYSRLAIMYENNGCVFDC